MFLLLYSISSNFRNTISNTYPIFIILAYSNVWSQNCPNMSTVCANAPLVCGIDQLNGHICNTVLYSNYTGDRCSSGSCWASDDNTAHYAFTTNGTPFSINLNYSNCQVPFGTDMGLLMEINSECCSGKIYCIQGGWTSNGITTVYINGKLDPCKIYYLNIDGTNGSACDYTLSVTGGASNVPLVLKDINNQPGKIIQIKKGSCSNKFTVDPRDAPCKAYMDWTLDGNPINDHDNEIQLSFPVEGDFLLCAQGYVGLPNFNCGQSNITCTKIEVRQEHRFGNTRFLCNEQKPYKWFKQTINTSGTYTQEFQDKCTIFDSTIEFIILPKPQAGIVNYISCTKSDPYFDPVYKDYYKECTHNKNIPIPKSTELYACDSSYILNVAYIEIKNTMHLVCSGGNVFMVPELTNYSDTCGIGVEFDLAYSWYEKTNNDLVYLSNSRELKITKKANYQLQLLVAYRKGSTFGTCVLNFDDDIDEDLYLVHSNTGVLLGKSEVCKGDTECYAIKDIVQNPFNFNWSIDEGIILTPDPKRSDSICVMWDKQSLKSSGQLCARYSDSCSSDLTACLAVSFGISQKDIAGPDQEVKGVLGTKMKAQGTSGMWSFSGGPGTVRFTNPEDPNTRVKVTRFGNYMFKWTTHRGDCEVYDYVNVNFYIEFPELEGDYPVVFKNVKGTESQKPEIRATYQGRTLQINGDAHNSNPLHYKLVNINGNLLHSGNIYPDHSTFADQIKLDLAPGIYFLFINSGTQNKVLKFLIM